MQVIGIPLVKLIFNGWIFIIEVCFVIAIVVIIERTRALSKIKFDAKKFLADITEILKKGGTKKALELCEVEKNPLSNVIKEGLKNASLGRDDVSDALDESLVRERAVLEKRVGMLSIIAFIAPLLGLLGTVVGIIQAFSAMAIKGADPTAMLNGVAVALLTTAFGIITAVPAAIGFGFLSGRIDYLANEIDAGGKDLIIALSEHVWGKKPRKSKEE